MMARSNLHLAILYPHSNRADHVRRVLAIHPECLNEQDEYGITPLMLACMTKKIQYTDQVVAVLLMAGADPNIQDNDKWTCIMYAMRYPTKYTSDIIQMLLNSGASTNIQNDNGQNVLHLGVANIMLGKRKSYPAVKVLMNCGIYMDETSHNLCLMAKL